MTKFFKKPKKQKKSVAQQVNKNKHNHVKGKKMKAQAMNTMKYKSVYGISFDGVCISGVTAEYIKLTRYFQKSGYKIYLDLGYDIKADKGNFFIPYTQEIEYLPDWINLERLSSLSKIPEYNPSLVEKLLSAICQDSDLAYNSQDWRLVEEISESIAQLLIEKWYSLNVEIVIVENGTLPENIIFTKAVYKAIIKYGEQRNLGKYAFWRDHDLMWFSEVDKYGERAIKIAVKPVGQKYIHHVVLHDAAKKKMMSWSKDTDFHVLPNCFNFSQKLSKNWKFRKDYNIPHDAIVIARSTRLIRQKRIDRDIYITGMLNQQRESKEKEVYLFIAGKNNEDRQEYERLKKMSQALNVEDKIIFGDGLKPLENYFKIADVGKSKYGIGDLMADSQLSSFLTAFGYDGYGNPPGEAIASKIPFISTNYELYDSVYGVDTYKTNLLEVSKDKDDLPSHEYINEVNNLLRDERKCREIANYNYQVGIKKISTITFQQKLLELFPNHLSSLDKMASRDILLRSEAEVLV